MTNKQFLLIPQDIDEATVIIDVPTDNELGQLQQHVDGYVECIAIRPDLDMWANEEGKFRGDFTRNGRAQKFWDEVHGKGTDVIMGPVVLTGGSDNEGETLGLTADQIAGLQADLDLPPLHFRLDVKLTNAALRTPADVSRVLTKLGARLRAGAYGNPTDIYADIEAQDGIMQATILDYNGQQVGSWEVSA